MTALSGECENKIRQDCERLFAVLKNCDAPDQDERDAESVKALYRLVFLLSHRPGSKMMAIATTTAGYLCHHAKLPVILVEILRDSENIHVCGYVLDLLAKLVLKNALVGEAERKAVRRAFHEPQCFRTVVQALRNMDARFASRDAQECRNHDMQVRFLKIINCMYSRKGQSQISLISDINVEFLGRHFVKHSSSDLELSRCMLPLIKTICRNRRNCCLLCNGPFVNAFVTLVPAANRYPAGISILRFLSRSPEALTEMSHSEAVYNFVVQTAIHHGEKSTHKKYLMSAMYRLAKTSYGMQLLKNTSLWTSLLEFFMKSERLDELRQRMSFTRSYTILHRGVWNKFVAAAPLKIDFDLPKDIQAYICARANHQTSDDSDNEEEDDEEDHQRKDARSRTVSADNDESDTDNEDVANDDIPRPDLEADDQSRVRQRNEDDGPRDWDSYFAEFRKVDERAQRSFAPFSWKVRRHPLVDRLALPDLLPHIEDDDDRYLTPSINIYSVDELCDKIISLKNRSPRNEFQPKVVFDLDALIARGAEDARVPTLEEIRRNYLSRRGDKVAENSATLKFESRFECGNLRRVEQIGAHEYDLFVAPDVNVAGGLQWFYFQASGTRARQSYAFNVVNLQKCNSQFSYGLQPVMFSALGYALKSRGWRKCGTQLMYYGNEYIARESNKQFRTLRFCVTFEYDEDVCYFAYHFPYTYSRLLHVALAPFALPSDDVYVRVEELARTVGGFNAVPLITVTGRNARKIALEFSTKVCMICSMTPMADEDLKHVFLKGGGESNASWIMEGAMRFLLSEDPRAATARENYVFKLVPILNPEGVIYGNARCGLAGDDLNRCWKTPHPRLHPEIYNAKELVRHARARLPNEIFAFVDIHGHSRKKFFFLYGCDPRQSWNDADAILSDAGAPFDALPTAMAGIAPSMRMSYCSNAIDRKRETTCRVVMWREFAINRSHTLECSFCAGENKKIITTATLRDIGESLIKALADMVSLPA